MSATFPRRFQIKLTALTAVATFALLLTGWALYSRFSQTNAIRNAQQRVWHAVICSLEQQTLKSRRLTPRQKQAELRLFDRLLVNDVHAEPCGLVTKPGGHGA